MHPAAWDFVRRIAQSLPPLRRVAEFGSRRVNGSVSEIFTDAIQYVGIDKVAGDGVATVMDAADWVGAGFDCVVCCEVFEHTPRVFDLCKSAFRALRPGGYFIVTYASPSREPHGVDGGELGLGEYYGSPPASQVFAWLLEAGFSIALFDGFADVFDEHLLALKAR